MCLKRESVFVLSVSLNVSCVIRSPARHIVMRGWEGITANPTLRCKRAGTRGDWINLIRQPAIYPSKCYATSNHKIRNITDHRKQRMQKKALAYTHNPCNPPRTLWTNSMLSFRCSLNATQHKSFQRTNNVLKKSHILHFWRYVLPWSPLMMYISIETIFVKNIFVVYLYVEVTQK